MPEPYIKEPGWRAKFRHAFRGTKRGLRGQSSFFVHLFITALVIATATVLKVDRTEWCLLVLCITVVLTAEMFNSALEWLAKAIDVAHNPHLREALDVGSAAVLIAAIGAAIVGAIIFVERLVRLLGW